MNQENNMLYGSYINEINEKIFIFKQIFEENPHSEKLGFAMDSIRVL